MDTEAEPRVTTTTIREDDGAIYVSLELSRSKWMITSLCAGSAKMSRHSVDAGSMAGLLARLGDLREKALARSGRCAALIVIQEAGLDGFSIHRALVAERIESHVVDAASIAVPRRARRVKTDRIDGEVLVRTLMAWKRGEPRICAMVRVPSAEEEDRRQVIRERKTLIVERTRCVNRIKGLTFAQGVSGYEPLRRDRRARLETLETHDGRPLGHYLKARIGRELDRLEQVIEQIAQVGAARDALLAPAAQGAAPQCATTLLELVGIGPEFAAVLWCEGLFRHFANRRQVAAYAGLVPTPWQSGQVRREQGVSRAGNPRLRTTMIQLAWLWLRNQPDSDLSKWFQKRAPKGGRGRKPAIVALARKLLVALWKYVTAGVVIDGARMKEA